MNFKNYTRREFIKKNSLTGLGALLGTGLSSILLNIGKTDTLPERQDPVIDIHQHTNYSGRTHEQLIAHQREMGATKTILLPAGSPVNTAATHHGAANGLGSGVGGNEVSYKLAQKYPNEFLFAANEVPGLPDTIQEIEKYLKLGAQMIGECKFGVECDSIEMQEIYNLAQKYDVPVLMHWEYEKYNYGFLRFHEMLEKYPTVNFIGHSRTWWANIDKDFKDQSKHSYPAGKVTPGGYTDQLLSNYPNAFGDLSQTSGVIALLRDEDFTRDFLDRHQDQLLFGSDCSDRYPTVQQAGVPIIEAIRRLSPTKEIERKLLYKNARKLLKL